jgi:hypothetical protein
MFITEVQVEAPLAFMNKGMPDFHTTYLSFLLTLLIRVLPFPSSPVSSPSSSFVRVQVGSLGIGIASVVGLVFAVLTPKLIDKCGVRVFFLSISSLPPLLLLTLLSLACFVFFSRNSSDCTHSSCLVENTNTGRFDCSLLANGNHL